MIGTKTAVEELHEDSHVNAIRTWLNPPEPSVNFAKAQATRYEGTGMWFLDNNNFQRWKLGKCQYLWLHGIPGCGKTVLISSIIEYPYGERENNLKKILLTFFFDFTELCGCCRP
jgi:hypothetical protein